MNNDNFKNDKFDAMLTNSLQSRYIPTPADFTKRTLTLIEQQQQKKALALIAIKEKLALTAAIAWVIIMVFAVRFLPAMTESFNWEFKMFLSKIINNIEAGQFYWQTYITVIAALVFAFYNFDGVAKRA